MGSLYFCLAVHELLSSTKSSITIGYLDDVSLGGEANTVAEDFVMLEKSAAKLGLTLNRNKCEVVGLTDTSRLLFVTRGISLKEVDAGALTLLGSPLMSGDGLDSMLASKKNDLMILAGRLNFLPAHDSLYLLRNVVTTPRLMYTLRTSPCTSSSVLVEYDEFLRSTVSSTLNVDLSDAMWLQASLPVRWGGLGIRSAVMLAPSAYLASAAGTANLVLRLLPSFLHSVTDRAVPLIMQIWQSTVDPSTSPPDLTTAHLQRSWDDPRCKTVSTSLLASATDDSDRARILASQCSTSGAWLQCLPLSAIGLHMDNDAVRVAVGLRLGANLCAPHICVCGASVNALGTHGLACKKSAGRHPRHGILNDIIWRGMQRAQIPSSKEPVGLFRSDGKRPDGVSLIPWALGRCLTWDVTSPDTLAPSHLATTAIHAGSAAEKAAVAKIRKYTSLLSTHIFLPLAFETLGAWGTQATSFISELGRRLSAITGDVRETSYLRQRLSVAIQRGNAIACRGTMSGAWDQKDC